MQLLSAVPFTPATGERVLFRPTLDIDERNEILSLLAQYLIAFTKQQRLSSSHMNFIRYNELHDIQPFERQGFLLRQTVQYRYLHNSKLPASVLD